MDRPAIRRPDQARVFRPGEGRSHADVSVPADFVQGQSRTLRGLRRRQFKIRVSGYGAHISDIASDKDVRTAEMTMPFCRSLVPFVGQLPHGERAGTESVVPLLSLSPMKI